MGDGGAMKPASPTSLLLCPSARLERDPAMVCSSQSLLHTIIRPGAVVMSPGYLCPKRPVPICPTTGLRQLRVGCMHPSVNVGIDLVQ